MYVPQEPVSESAVKWDQQFFVLTQEDWQSNHLQMSLQRQHFLLSYLKTLRVDPARLWTRDLLLRRQVPYQYLACTETPVPAQPQNNRFILTPPN